ncbi:leucyl/phenylalanyl-tRNA--protein transferase [Legionella taurinensis]|uniref:Leucyl/phenylalanyl-tRNA--protein transferase n=1 Tax=Legionella taurinensis TaxID=70611 RepID=A0A3A5LBL5_9GAMM|nr:leucyl/phenylalanyl-tRNA--protein transferase [Legionella taurinensis]MDX1836601.1 leucyl/phenylalanyl-tRNA--protein transferase [Legionella taurinensis]PUT42939.1 leucyl/phenylalanyl-tRNA--protein transferase [Legionella taurinensis]PUT45494.1 leucyl/phenylalanyl-tRNA--protein transferase [Legionella taurinensis]PUT46931.1 leucyl/phenylalanyl-tRNA--protein transferase [Legionella taurinensis]PUT49261.1 leucyl/phenylalanyl-tRNA--protein transferase [Legionella taurinensis]
MTFLTGDDFVFPNPNQSDEEGLLAVGGDLAPHHLLQAYSQGIFPWYQAGSPILWWSPPKRLLLKPNQFNVSHSLKKALHRPHVFRRDSHFSEIIKACASCEGRGENHTWITPEMQEAYIRLHHLGYAHSFEIWTEDNELCGGLYGLSLGRAFFGESMFHYRRDASKMAMYYLCKTLADWQFDFIDCQLPTAHLMSLGAVIVERSDFLKRLKESLTHPTRQGSWQPH